MDKIYVVVSTTKWQYFKWSHNLARYFVPEWEEVLIRAESKEEARIIAEGTHYVVNDLHTKTLERYMEIEKDNDEF